MTDNELQLFLATQDRMAEEQRRMAEDISEIKVAVKEASQIFLFMQKSIDQLQLRIEKMELIQTNCPARQRALGYGMLVRDVGIIVSIASAIYAFYKGM